MPSFHSVFHSAAEYDLQALLGEEPLQLLQAVDESLLRPSRLREVVMDLRSPASLLLNSESRTVLMDLLRRKEAERLAGLLDLDTSEPFDALRSVSIRKGSTKERRCCTSSTSTFRSEIQKTQSRHLSATVQTTPFFRTSARQPGRFKTTCEVRRDGSSCTCRPEQEKRERR